MTEMQPETLEGLDFELECDGAWDDCTSGDAPSWVAVSPCCGQHRLFCTPCKQITHNFYARKAEECLPSVCRNCQAWNPEPTVFKPLGEL